MWSDVFYVECYVIVAVECTEVCCMHGVARARDLMSVDGPQYVVCGPHLRPNLCTMLACMVCHVLCAE